MKFESGHPFHSVFMFLLAVSGACRQLHAATGVEMIKPLSQLEAFSMAAGTQTIGASYQFTKETKLVETARAILEMGSNILKFSLAPENRSRASADTLAGFAASDPSVRTVFKLPFAHYLMWCTPLGAPKQPPFAPENLDAEYHEIYGLSKFLLQTYNDTGKSFYLGNWEGDWLLTHENPNHEPSDEEVRNMTAWANARQRAVDDARRDTPHRNVSVYYYIEVNRVRDARNGKVRVTNKVLPQVNPDFVSYSAYDSQSGDVEAGFAGNLDYIQTQLRPKPGLVEKRVFIGEYGMPAKGNSPEAQARLTCEVLRAGLRWGCQFILYWEIYNNETTPEGGQRGYWLIDDRNVKQPAYFIHAGFLGKAKAYTAAFQERNKRLPTRGEFGAASLEWLPGPRDTQP